MSTQRFSQTQYSIDSLVGLIDSGMLSLPDLQRPFVWDRARVRDLFDSLYRGYPAGYFLFWATAAKVDNHAVGTAERIAPMSKMIVDGQQRLTSIYSVFKGEPVLTADNEEQLIRISFRPLTAEFSVANAATENDPEWLTSISDIWTSDEGQYAYINRFITELKASQELSPDLEKNVADALGRLASLQNYQFSALELSADLEIDEVAEVFVRINSQGISLNSADFILTLMSVFAPEQRHQLEDFARAAKVPTTGEATPYNHFHAPSPDQLLRVAVGLGLRRGVLQNAYQTLRGRDPETKVVSEEYRNEQFAKLAAAQDQVVNLTNWHEYMVAVKRAGYHGGDMLTSVNNFLYCYLFFLIGRHEYQVGQSELRESIARWFFMSSITGRYTGSPETILEADLRRFAEANDADEFVEIIDHVIDTQLTADFWKVTLPDLFDSSGAWSPYLFGYYAALNLLDAKALFSKVKIDQLFAPGMKGTKSPVERHHLFPKAYLSSIGITGATRTNQMANFAFVEWGDNNAISDTKPSEYFPEFFDRLSPAEQEQAMFWHALPQGWHNMDYFDFLRTRRQLMAEVVEAGFQHLREGLTLEPGDQPHTGPPTVSDLLRQMETHRVEFKKSARVALENDAPEKVINEGVIKTVAAFLNSSGGTLGIGITDDGDILGLQPDLDFKHQDLDGYQNWLTTLLINSIGGGTVGALVNLRIEPAGTEVVCLVDVEPSSKPVYAKTTKGDQCFYVRISNTTRMLEGPELVTYVDQHFES